MKPGDLVGNRFLLSHLAGAGGMGEVYKALDQRTGLAVAIKALTAHGGDYESRFAREARILAELDHPEIVRYVAHGALASGAPYLAMEWLEGEDLSARLSRGGLGAAESIALAVRVAEVLGFAHARGVVHRDLKPSNIFLVGGRLETIKLLDFGIAQVGAATRITRTGGLVGTPGYLAPEQARGDERLDTRADVFSLGCVLFECLTGEPAFPGGHVMAILTKILFEEPPRLREKRPEMPEALDSLLHRMLAKNPDERPRDGGIVAEALRALGDVCASAVSYQQARPSPPSKALTGSEQRAVAVILIGAPNVEENSLEERREAATIDCDVDATLQREAGDHGGRFEHLLGGSVAVMLTSTRIAMDLAAQAARCALSLRAHAPGRPIALALGRGATTGRAPMGQAIDRAARLVGGSPNGYGPPETIPIVLDDVTAGLLDARFDVRETPAGFVLHGERELAEGTRTLLGKATPCVGRDWELGTLERLFDQCVAESVPWAVLVTGPAGAGKSRLGQELLRHIDESGAKVALWYGRGDPLRAGSAFGLLSQCLRRACGIQDGEPLDVRRQKLVARVAEQVAERERRRVAEFLGEMIGAPLPDDDSLPLRAARKDAQLMNDQMRAAFLDFLAAECAARPVVIGFEDLHWGDLPTVQFVDRALRDLHAAPLFVIALARPEVHDLFPQLWGERQVQEIRVKQLHRKAIERLVRHVLGERADRAMIERIERLSEGNAFYLEELIRWAVEGGTELPETLVAMVQSRLGALDDEARRILRAASIFGEAFWAGGVAALLGGAEHAPRVRERLRELIDREVVIKRGESRFPGEEEVAFRHALLREGAYAMLTDEDRVLGHGLAGGWLEEHGEQDALLLAEHFEKGSEPNRAGRHFLRAAEQANRGGDSKASIAFAQRGLACSAREDLRIGLLGMLCESAMWHTEVAVTSLPYADELSLKTAQGSTPWAQAMLVKLYAALHSGRIEDFLATLRNLRDIDPSPDATAPFALGLATSVYLLDFLARIQEAEVVLDRLIKIASTPEHLEPTAQWLLNAIPGARDAYAREDPAMGLGHCQAALTIAHAAKNHKYSTGTQVMIGMNQWFLGLHAEAERVLKEQTVPAEELGYASSVRTFVLAWLLADRGNVHEAREWAARLVASGKARNIPLDEGRGHWALAEVLRRAGEFDAADVEIQAALALLGMACPLDQPGALATLAALRLSEGRLTEALAAAEEGLTKYESTGACGMFRGAFLRLTHAECLEATGDHAAARVAIDKARQWILNVAGKVSDPAHRKCYLENVPENRRTLELAQQASSRG